MVENTPATTKDNAKGEVATVVGHQGSDESGSVALADEGLLEQKVAIEATTKNTVLRSSIHTGPLPPPQMLRDYDTLLPGLAERIVRMAESEYQLAEREQQFRHKEVTANFEHTRRFEINGRRYAMTAFGLALDTVVFAILRDAHAVAGVIGTTTISAVVYAFITARKPAKNQQKQDEDSDNPPTNAD